MGSELPAACKNLRAPTRNLLELTLSPWQDIGLAELPVLDHAIADPASKADRQRIITDQLADRAAGPPDFLREKLALQTLAEVMSDHQDEVLPRLVKLGMEICEAQSAGISILEPESGQFRWHALAGGLARFEGATTPRNFSPCGICLDLAEPILMERPERAYDWICEARITVPEVLLVPLTVKGSDAIGTLGWCPRKPATSTRNTPG